MARIIVLGVKVPFTTGGQDALMGSLVRELKRRDHAVDTVELPFQVQPKEGLLNQVAMWRALDLNAFGGTKTDLIICTKFPSYFAHGPKKSLWLVHQHREMYELFGTRYSDFSDDPRDEQLRRLLMAADQQALAECDFRGAISHNVAQRTVRYHKLFSEVLYPPLPLAGRYYTAPAQDYILSVGRICSIKRVDLMIKALPMIHRQVVLKVAGTPDEPGVMDYLKNEIAKHHLQDRVQFLGRVSDEELLKLYAESLAVYYAPHDEDYGYVTLEAFASSKPVVAAHDSGGVLEFVQDGISGLVTDPTTDAIAKAFNRLIEDRTLTQNLGRGGRDHIEKLGIEVQGWDFVVERLLSPLSSDKLSRQSAA